MKKGALELRCSREVALWLGASDPESLAAYRALREQGQLLIRTEGGRPMFWPWAVNRAGEIPGGPPR